MSSNYSSWVLDINKLGESFPRENFAEAIYKLAHGALRLIVFYSPVGNPTLWKSVNAGKSPPPGYVGGRFRNNWFVSISIGGGFLPETRDVADKSGSASMNEGRKFETLKTKPYSYIVIHNSLPYAIRLEEGWSTQAPGPAAIVGRTYNDLKSITDIVV